MLPLSEGAGGIGPDSPRGFSLRMNDRTGRRSRSAGGVRIETLGASSVPEVLCGQGLVGHYFRHGLDSKRVAVLDHLLDPWGLGLVHIEAEDRFDLAVQRGFGVVALNRQFVPCRSKVRVGKRPLIKPHQNALHQTIHPGLEVVGGNRSCRVREVPKRLRVHVLGRGGVQEDANAVGTDGEVRPKPPATDTRQIVRLSPIDARNTTVGGLPAKTPPVPRQPFGHAIGGESAATAHLHHFHVQGTGEEGLSDADPDFTQAGFVLRYRSRHFGKVASRLLGPFRRDVQRHVPRRSHSRAMKDVNPSSTFIG